MRNLQQKKIAPSHARGRGLVTNAILFCQIANS
nr:MAG TPA: hypothetical protein [Caudoviricetes sp.]